MTTTLAIETSCDDTSLAIVSYDDGVFTCEQIKAYSQVKDHQIYGGVVPEIASRKHSEEILSVYNHMPIDWDCVDHISVTDTPGLPGSLLVGRSFASTLSEYYHKPLIRINHVHGHLLSFLLERRLSDIKFPTVVLSVSGGHNDLYVLSDCSLDIDYALEKVGPFFVYKLGRTIDDAAGEAFDKVSRMLGGPYPGGPWISKQAEAGGNTDIHFTPPFLHSKDYLFSFSGIKGQVYFYIDQLIKSGNELTDAKVSQIAYSFQESVTEVLSKKAIQASEEFRARSIALVGGVSANTRLRKSFQDHFGGCFYTPSQFAYCTDNAAMIGVVGLLS